MIDFLNMDMLSFEQQFSIKRRIDFHGRVISFIDVVPSVLRNSVPIFIAPGWGETPKTFKDLINHLFDAGFRVVSVTHLRQDLKLITKESISRVEYQKAQIILAILLSLRIDKVSVIAHSEGAINAVIAAHSRSYMFERILLVGPGGLVENEGFIELSGRFIGNLIQCGLGLFKDSITRAHVIRSGIETLKYFFMNPVMGLLEGSAISRTHLYALLVDLHENGVSVGIIHGTDDLVFPVNKMEGLKNLPWIDFQSVSDDHSGIYIYPKKYALIFQKCLLTNESEKMMIGQALS